VRRSSVTVSSPEILHLVLLLQARTWTDRAVMKVWP
jgi:hypothetical protein